MRAALATAASMLLCLLILDLGVGAVVGKPYGADPAQASQLAHYFDYGRSIEGKVLAMVGADGSTPHPLAQTGWIEPLADQPERPGEGQDLLIAGYGMSFAANILQRMHDLDGRIAVRFGGGPGATLSHSYALYTADRGHHDADVVVLGILASSLPGLVTISHMTWNFEGPSPHFYPRFSVVDGKLTRYVPSIGSLTELQAAARDPSRWRVMVTEIATHDEFYDPWVFQSSFIDESVLARLARRGWGQRSKRGVIERFHDGRGFSNELGLIDVTGALVNAFISQVRSDGKLPIVLAINDRGYADHLHRVLAPLVADGRALYFSTHEIAPASENGNFVRDGHFVPVKDQLFARKLVELVNRRLERRPRMP